MKSVDSKPGRISPGHLPGLASLSTARGMVSVQTATVSWIVAAPTTAQAHASQGTHYDQDVAADVRTASVLQAQAMFLWKELRPIVSFRVIGSLQQLRLVPQLQRGRIGHPRLQRQDRLVRRIVGIEAPGDLRAWSDKAHVAA